MTDKTAGGSGSGGGRGWSPSASTFGRRGCGAWSTSGSSIRARRQTAGRSRSAWGDSSTRTSSEPPDRNGVSWVGFMADLVAQRERTKTDAQTPGAGCISDFRLVPSSAFVRRERGRHFSGRESRSSIETAR